VFDAIFALPLIFSAPLSAPLWDRHMQVQVGALREDSSPSKPAAAAAAIGPGDTGSPSSYSATSSPSRRSRNPPATALEVMTAQGQTPSSSSSSSSSASSSPLTEPQAVPAAAWQRSPAAEAALAATGPACTKVHPRAPQFAQESGGDMSTTAVLRSSSAATAAAPGAGAGGGGAGDVLLAGRVVERHRAGGRLRHPHETHECDVGSVRGRARHPAVRVFLLAGRGEEGGVHAWTGAHHEVAAAGFFLPGRRGDRGRGRGRGRGVRRRDRRVGAVTSTNVLCNLSSVLCALECLLVYYGLDVYYGLELGVESGGAGVRAKAGRAPCFLRDFSWLRKYFQYYFDRFQSCSDFSWLRLWFQWRFDRFQSCRGRSVAVCCCVGCSLCCRRDF